MQCFGWPDFLLLCLGSQMPRYLTIDASQKLSVLNGKKSYYSVKVAKRLVI